MRDWQKSEPVTLPTRVFVTGANGFVGRRLCIELARRGHAIRAGVRDASRAELPGEIVTMGSLCGATDWGAALTGIDVVIHLAARVHVMKETAADALAEYRLVNVEGTRSLAQSAATHGVRRLLYVSSVKVNGEETAGKPFTFEDAPSPEDPYAVSKWEAECVLRSIASDTGLEVTVVRPPLVYGPRVRGNFLRLLNMINAGVPLPLGGIRNRRSMIYDGNLADVLAACVDHENAAGKTYMVSDGEDLSTTDLIRRLAVAMGARARILTMPPMLLELAGALTARRAEIRRLTASLTVDSSPIRSDLDWSPRYSVAEGLGDTARWYAGQNL